jgi:tetratricopeptide (TPR) repeat protein
MAPPESLGELLTMAWKELFGGPEEKKFSKAISRLRDDWISDNSELRDECATRQSLEKDIKAAELAAAGLKNPVKLLDLAEAYGILDPKDPRCLSTCEMVSQVAIPFLEMQRQGDAHQLFGRSLFFAERYEECLEALLKAQEAYRIQGTKELRKRNNIGLMRAYAALGRSKETAQRFEVALTMVGEAEDDFVGMYVSAKSALEETGVARDAEILDDIWYVYLDLNPPEKEKYNSYVQMGENLGRSVGNEEDDLRIDWWRLGPVLVIVIGGFLAAYIAFAVWVIQRMTGVKILR